MRFIWAQLRGRPRRTLALLAGVLVATTGFTVLSAGAAISQLRINDAVATNYRPAYDILVRPKGSRTSLEEDRGLVRPNYLSGLFGGITNAQLERVRSAAHVEIAAPIAMLGYSRVYLEQTVDLTDQLDPTARSQLFRLTPSWIADRGLTVLNDAPQYVYVTRDQVSRQELGGPVSGYRRYENGTPVSPRMSKCYAALEVRPDGSKGELCLSPNEQGTDGTTVDDRTYLQVRTVGSDGRFSDVHPVLPRETTDRLVIALGWDVMVLAAAIDPSAEAGLVDLDKAVVSGRYLSTADQPAMRTETEPGAQRSADILGVPALVASTPYVDEQLKTSVERLGADAATGFPDKSREEWVPALAKAPGTPSGTPTRSGSPTIDQTPVRLGFMYQSGTTRYHVDENGALHPETGSLSKELWQVPTEDGGHVVDYQPPIFALDNSFRPVSRVGALGGDQPSTVRVGEFDPARLRGFSPLSAVPLETYQAPEATGADARSQQLLGGQPLRPNSNPAGYLATPPLVLTNLATVDRLPASDAQRAAPISAIRVRVAGVTGFDPDSRALVRSVAGDIARSTGLDVDITIGSSPEPQTVVLPAGKGGRPELRLSEGWSRKGVAVRIVTAADRKSLVLFGLILLVCALFLGNAVAAAVRDRRRELAVLACLGWPASRLAFAILGEVGLVGLTAGGVAAGIAVPLSHLVGVSLSGGHALLAVPVGIGIALLAAATPALRAARAHPGAAVHPAVIGVRRAHRRRTILGVALANLTRVPGRTALGVVALAVGIASLTMLVAIGVAFHNEVIGSRLGDAVALRVRLVDLLAALAAVVLGVFALADILYINIRERSAELAALWASGWTDRALLRLVGYEGLAIGALGAVAGALVGLFGTLWIAGTWSAALIWLAIIVAGAAVAVTVLVALIPALLLRRFPLATLLAEE
jgi:putative ABC transport system permease protein